MYRYTVHIYLHLYWRKICARHEIKISMSRPLNYRRSLKEVSSQPALVGLRQFYVVTLTVFVRTLPRFLTSYKTYILSSLSAICLGEFQYVCANPPRDESRNKHDQNQVETLLCFKGQYLVYAPLAELHVKKTCILSEPVDLSVRITFLSRLRLRSLVWWS